MGSDHAPEPLIIPRSEHIISRKDIDREALKVMYRLRDAGFVAYLVGGGVRDLYLGKKPKDFDLSTNARPGELRSLFRNSRIIGKRFRLVQVFFHGGKIVEVSTFRCRTEHEFEGMDTVLPANNTFGTAAEDAFRRDLTINALFYEIENFSIIDYTGGVADLNARIIRMVGDPVRRIIRDPVRMLRALRHAARTGFSICTGTWDAIVANAEHLSACPSSRLRDEFFKDLYGGACRAWFDLARAAGIFSRILPCYDEGFFAVAVNAEARLRAVLGVLDRLSVEGRRPSEPITLCLLLLPWLEDEFDLFRLEAQQGGPSDLSRQIRERLEVALGQLNVTRAAKENSAALLAALPQISAHERNSSWPKWLARKSYFKEGLNLYGLYQESLGGPQAELQAGDGEGLEKPGSKNGGRRAFRREGRAPAFSGKKGGVFGFRG